MAVVRPACKNQDPIRLKVSLLGVVLCSQHNHRFKHLITSQIKFVFELQYVCNTYAYFKTQCMIMEHAANAKIKLNLINDSRSDGSVAFMNKKKAWYL